MKLILLTCCSARKYIEFEAINTGQEGLNMIREENFNLILLDLGMPDFSGMDVLVSPGTFTF